MHSLKKPFKTVSTWKGVSVKGFYVSQVFNIFYFFLIKKKKSLEGEREIYLTY